MSKNKKRVLTVAAVVFLALTTLGVAAAIRWKGSDVVDNIHLNLLEVRERLSNQKEKIIELENNLDNSVSNTDHQAIIDAMETQHANNMAAKDAIIQQYMIQVQELNAKIAQLENEVNAAYDDVVGIDEAIINILDDTE